MLQRGNTYAHGMVISCKHNADGNIIGILDTLYTSMSLQMVKALHSLPMPLLVQCMLSATLLLEEFIDIKFTDNTLTLATRNHCQQ